MQLVNKETEHSVSNSCTGTYHILLGNHVTYATHICKNAEFTVIYTR